MGWYWRHMIALGFAGGKSGAVTVTQRVSSDLRQNPHFHTLAFDGVSSKAKQASARSIRAPRSPTPTSPTSCRSHARASSVAAFAPGTVPAGPAPRRQEPIKLRNAAALAQTKGSCAAEHRFSLHAAPIAAADDRAGREALCKYIRRPLQARA